MFRTTCQIIAAALFLALSAAPAGERSVTVFTARANATEKEVFKDFETATDIAVTLVEGKPEELIDRIAKGEGGADLFMTVDGGILETAKQKGVFGTTDSPALREAVPVHLRDNDNAWVGVATRARVIVYAKDRVRPEQLSTYADLADPKWKGKVLIRSSGALYNQSLLASLIAAYGEEAAGEGARGVAANLAREPKGGDRDQAKAVAAGEGDVAVMNSYYIGHMLKSKDEAEAAAAKAVGVFFPDQEAAGTHINICGVGLTKNAENPEDALKLVEYLLSAPVQEKLSLGNSEFPVNPLAKKAPLLESWGEFKTQSVDFAELARNRAKATEILESTNWK